MHYLQLAYLAELSVVLNLALGEFKHEEIKKTLEQTYENLDKTCTSDYFVALKPAVRGTTDPSMKEIPSPIGKSLKRLDGLRRARKEQPAEDYSPLRGFLGRVALFSSSPDVDSSTVTGRWVQKVFRLPMATLCAWVYSKTPLWCFPSCRSALWLWLITIVCGPTVAFAAVYVAPTIELHRSIFFLLGALLSLALPRPIAHFAGKFTGRGSDTPRGRSYPLILVLLVLSIIAISTLLDVTHWLDDRLWWLFCGFLLGSCAIPICMFVGYLGIESALKEWEQWIGAQVESKAPSAVENAAVALNELLKPANK